LGQGIEGSSGRAISLLQQAGIAELGPYMVAVRTWRLRVYRALWTIVQRYWTAERWVRVTDDDGLAQFIQINGLATDQYGQPALANAIGTLDVDIILDEGPDNINLAADAYDTLLALVRGGTQIPPDVLIELAPLQNSIKQKLLQRLEQQQNNPQKAIAQAVALQGEAAKTAKTKSETVKNLANAARDIHDAHADAADRAFVQQQYQAPGTLPDPTLGAGVPGPGPAPVAPPPGFGPVPGATSPSQDVPSNFQGVLPFPGMMPPGARQAG